MFGRIGQYFNYDTLRDLVETPEQRERRETKKLDTELMGQFEKAKKELADYQDHIHKYQDQALKSLGKKTKERK